MSENEKAYNFDFEFQSKVDNIGDLEEKLRNEAETRLRKLSKGNTDLTGAAIMLEIIDKESQTPFRYRARVLVYTRPEHIVGIEEADSPQAAMKNALNVVERQVREKREKLRERWK